MVIDCTQKHDSMKVVGHHDMRVEHQSRISIWQSEPIPISDLPSIVEHHKPVDDLAKSTFHMVGTDRYPVHA
jgi:hypothetical protein